MKPWKLLYPLLVAHAAFAASCDYSDAEKTPLSKEMQGLMQTSRAFTKIAKTCSPAVVLIKVQAQQDRGLSSEFFNGPLDPFMEEFFHKFFGGGRFQTQNSPFQGAGSGFFASPDGYILTNNHVVKNAQKIAVVLNDGKELEAKVVGTDPGTDLAVLKVDIQDADYIRFADSSALDVGEWVVAIGHPFELRHTVTAGIVSATDKDRDDLPKITSVCGLVQTDAAINPGNSGGPLLNLNGELVGVNVAILTTTGSFAGVGFAIPSNVASYVFTKIVETGAVHRAYLGVILQRIDQEHAEATDLDMNQGILIAEVVENSPAQKAGLQSGDIILSMDGVDVRSVNSFRNKIALMTPETTVHLSIRRKNATIDYKVALGVLSELKMAAKKLFQKLGVEIEDMDKLPSDALARFGHSPSTSGVMITQVKRGSPAHIAGLVPNHHIVTGVVIDWDNQKKITSSEEFYEALQEVGDKKHVVLIIRQKNFQRYYTLRLQ